MEECFLKIIIKLFSLFGESIGEGFMGGICTYKKEMFVVMFETGRADSSTYLSENWVIKFSNDNTCSVVSVVSVIHKIAQIS